MEINGNPLLKVIIVSREETDERKKWIEKLKESGEYPYMFVMLVVNPNGVGLTHIYSDMIEKDPHNADIMLFIHDDIEFLRKGWAKEIVRLFKEHPDYGIIGVAGSKQFDQGGAWWNYPKRYGQVLHRKDGKSWLTAFSPLLKNDLEEVAVIDGLFMAVHKHRIAKNYDKEINGFNFYDIDFCLSNYIAGKCKIGVTTNIRVAHNSVGELKPNWYDNKEIVTNRYKKYYPIDVDTDKRKENGELNEKN